MVMGIEIALYVRQMRIKKIPTSEQNFEHEKQMNKTVREVTKVYSINNQDN